MYRGYTQSGVSNGVGLYYNGVSSEVGQHNGEFNNTNNNMVKVTIINISARESSDHIQGNETSKLNQKRWTSNKSSQNVARTMPKSLCFTIRPDDTVATLKSLIASQTNCSSWPERCVLYFQGRNLCDDKRLMDHGICNGEATLLMVARIEKVVRKHASSENQITIELANKSTFKIDVDWSSDIVEDVKKKVAMVLRIPVHGFHLKHQDTFMKNGDSISEYMPPGSFPTVQMITDDDIREAETGNLKILVELESGEMIPIESIHDTIAGLKHQIEIMTKIPQQCQRVVFNGDELQDHRTLSSYNLKRGNVVAVKTINTFR